MHSRTLKTAIFSRLIGFALASVLVLDAWAAVAQADEDRAGFRFKELDDKSLGVWEGERPVLVYNFGEMSLPEVRAAGVRSSYFHPIYGLDGEVLTDDFPSDHYHHHGLFWGWPHVLVGDREYDLWKMRGIHIQFQRWLARDANSDGAKLEFENACMVRDAEVMRERVAVQIHPATADHRSIDIAFTWTPPAQSITLGGAEGKSYGGVSLRFAKPKGTVVTVPGGPTKTDLLITKLPWADLSGQFRGAPQPSGAALFVDSQHPDFPPEWMTRDYGLLAVGWPGVHAKTLNAGESLTCRYRLWIHRGVADAAAIQAAYEEYSRPHQAKTGQM